ncbi:MAG: SHOCT domain-containing protein [Solirubrobacterales bacterium]|nr:SHOCT domain-containing protein [Solirubrobacterales bacterium]
MEILERRFAEGEITAEEYRSRQQVLDGDETPTASATGGGAR